MSIETVLRNAEKAFDRVSNNVQVIRKYRDKYKLHAELLEEKISLIQEIALQQIRILSEQIKIMKDEQNIKNNPKKQQTEFFGDGVS